MSQGFRVAADGVDEIDKDPTAVLPYGIDVYAWLRGSDRYWSPRVYVHPGETYTPQQAALNGHRYRCTVGGRTGSVPPTWPTSSGGTVIDGGVTWTEIGSEDTLTTADWSADTGITVGTESIDSTARVAQAVLSGGVAGSSYSVHCDLVSTQGKQDRRSFRLRVVGR